MKKSYRRKVISVITTLVMVLSIVSGCGDSAEKEEQETITVYLWNEVLFDDYARYIQERLPDINIQFIVGNGDIDFYNYMSAHGKLPDIITASRFSPHDEDVLRDHLMDLSMTNEVSQLGEVYVNNFVYPDESVYWLPICAEVDGIVVNRNLFDEYNIEIPTDYDSFVEACNAFEAVGIKGFAADFSESATYMELLQGLSVSELNSTNGREWRSNYEYGTDAAGLDNVVWPGAFERLEKFIKDTKLEKKDLGLNNDSLTEMFSKGEVAMIFSNASDVIDYNNNGVAARVLPFFGGKGESWIYTYPSTKVALNSNLENYKERKEKALKVLGVMASDQGQKIIAKDENLFSYERDNDLQVSPYLNNLNEYVNQDHMYISMDSNEFFTISNDVVFKMIEGEYNATKAYSAFNEQLGKAQNNSNATVLSIGSEYSNIFHSDGGNEAYSVMANSLRQMYVCDVLIAPGFSFTGSVFKGDYTEKMLENMIMSGSLKAWHCNLKGVELIQCLRIYVEGSENGFTPYNKGSLPVVSGISINVSQEDGKYKLEEVYFDGKKVNVDDTFRVTLLNTDEYMMPVYEKHYKIVEANMLVKEAWMEYIQYGGAFAEKEDYIKIK